MKKIIISSAAIALLLAGCGQENQGATKVEDKKETTIKKEDYVSDKEVKKEAQKLFDNLTKDFEDVSAMGTLDFDGSIQDQFRQIGTNFKNHTADYDKYLKSVKEPIKYTKPSGSIIKAYSNMGESFKKMGDLMESRINGNITEEEMNEEYEKLGKSFEDYDKEAEQAHTFFEKEGIDLSKLYKAINEDKSTTSEKPVTTENATTESITTENSTNQESNKQSTSTTEVISEQINTDAPYPNPTGEYDTNSPTYEKDENGNWVEVN